MKKALQDCKAFLIRKEKLLMIKKYNDYNSQNFIVACMTHKAAIYSLLI